MTYEDAVSAIEEDGGIPKIAVTVGDRQDAMGACLVTRVTDGSYLATDPRMTCITVRDEGEVLLTLNCNRGAATATTPGASMASVSGREFQAAAEETGGSGAERGSRARGGR